MSEIPVMSKPQRSEDTSECGPENGLDARGSKMVPIQKPEPVYFKKLNFLSKKNFLLENKKQEKMILEKSKERQPAIDSRKVKLDRNHLVAHTENIAVSENFLNNENKTDLVESIMKKLTVQEAQPIDNKEEKGHEKSVRRHNIFGEPIKSPSSAIPLATRSLILKKGWLYKRGEYFYSDWHPKWAVLRQELPLEVTMPASDTSHSSTALANPSDISVSAEFKGKNIVERIPAPILELYDDRSHMDAKLPPKYRIVLSAEVDISEISGSKDSKRYFWDILLPDLGVNEKNLDTAKKMSTKFQFATFASAEKDNWLTWLRTISCNASGWFMKYQTKGNSDGPRIKVAQVLQPIVAPSAPSKEDLFASNFEENQLKKNISQGKFPCSIQIPDAVPPDCSTLTSNNISDLSYAGVTILTQQSMLDILPFFHESKFKPGSCVVASSLVAAWKGTDWNGTWQQYNPGMSIATIERNLRERIYTFLGDFQNASSYFVIGLIDNLHLKGHFDLVEVQGSLKLQILQNEDCMQDINALRQLSLYLHSRKLSDRWRPLLRSLVRYKGFSVLVTAQPNSALEPDDGHERAIFEEIVPWYPGAEFAFDRNTGHIYLLDVHRKNASNVLRHELLLLDEFQHGSSNIANANICVTFRPEINESLEYDLFSDRQLIALAAKLDAMDFLPITSGLLVEFMHVHGLNLRDFGRLYQLSKLPHVQAIILLEIVCRSFKVYMRRLLQTAVLHLRSIHATRIESEMATLVISSYRKLLLSPSVEDSHLLANIINEKFSFKGGVSFGEQWREQLDSNLLFDTVNAMLGIVWLNIPPSSVSIDLSSSQFSDSDSSSPLLYTYLNFSEFLTVENFGGFVTNVKTSALYPLSYPYFRKASVDGWEGLGILSVSRNVSLSNCKSSLGDLGDCCSILLQNDLLLGHNLSNNISNSPTQLYFADSLKIQSPLPHVDSSKFSSIEHPSESPSFSLLPISAMACQAIGLYLPGKSYSFSLLTIMQACSPRLAIWFYLLARESFFVRDDLTSAVLYLNLAQYFNRRIIFQSSPRSNDSYDDSQSNFIAMRGNIQLYLQIILLWLQIRLSRPTCLSFLNNMEALMDSSFKTMIAIQGTMHPLSGRLAGTLAASYWQILGSSSSILLDDTGSPSDLALTLFRTLMHFQRTAVDIYYKSLGKCHFNTRQALLLLGCYGLWDRNSLEDSIASLNEALLQNSNVSLNSNIGLTTPYLSLFKADIHIALGEALTRHGSATEALCHVQTAKSIKESLLGVDHPQCIQIYYQLAAIIGLLVHGGGAGSGINIGNTDSFAALQCGFSSSSRLLHLASWMMTPSSKEHALEGLACYERIFQFLKYSRVSNTTTNNQLPLSVGCLVLSPIRLAVFSPPSIFIDNPKICATCTDDAYLSTQLHAITKHILALKILLLEPTQKEILRRLYKKHLATQFLSLPLTHSAGDIAKGPFSLSESHHSLAFRNDLVSNSRRDASSIQNIAAQSPASFVNWKQISESPLFHSVIMKLIAYSPGAYFSGIVEKLTKHCNGTTVDALIEQECLSIFALLEEQ